MNKETLNKIIRNRKTIYPTQFSDKDIPKTVINEILENAIHAPTHRMTQPWFFKVYKGKSKDVLCEIIQKIDKEKYSPVKINKFIEKVKLSDTIISVCMTRDESNRVPEWEEIAATAMAVQNIWISCVNSNIGGYWSTPKYATQLKSYLKLAINERCLGIFYIGVYKTVQKRILNRKDIESDIEWFD